MKKKLTLYGLVALLALLSPISGIAQSPDYEPVSQAYTADDVDAAILIVYVGTGASGTVAVTTGDVLLKHGVLASEVADTTITRCGATDGTLDVDDAECNTLGELVDSINASANWRAVRQDSVQSDLVSGAALLTRSATAAKTRLGVPLFWDTSVSFDTTRLLVPPGYRNDISRYLTGIGVDTKVRSNPFGGRQTSLQFYSGTSTFATGTSTIQFIEDPAAFSVTLGAEADDDVVVFSTAGGATTVAKDVTSFQTLPFYFVEGRRALVRINNSAAASVVTQVATGKISKSKTGSLGS